jgi:protease-4
VDSPGGDALASDVIAEEILDMKEKKPVIISQGYVAASGGYWISMYGDEILAAPNTFTGSIGVLGAWIYNDGMKESMGMTTEVIKRGEHSDFDVIFRLPLIGIGLPDRPLTEEEREKALENIRRLYKDFVQKVADGRNMDYDAVHDVAQGRVWTGISGKDVGLIDELGGLARAVEIAREKAEIGDEYQIVEMPEKGLFDLDMFQPKLLGMEIKEDKMLNYLKLRIEHNGEPMPMLPMEALERIEQQ